MKHHWLPLTLVLPIEAFSQDASVQKVSQSLPRSTPEAQGVSSEGILAFLKEADAKIDTMHSFMLLRHGQVVAEA